VRDIFPIVPHGSYVEFHQTQLALAYQQTDFVSVTW
jgi:hypothetical protein